MAGIGYPINLGLGDAPDSEITPEVWQELNKLSLACKHIAAALGVGAVVGGNNGEHLVGTPAAGVTVQDFARIQIVPGFTVPAGSVLELNGTAVQLTSGSYPYPVAFAEETIPAGTAGQVTLLGMVHYPAGGLTPGAKYYIDYAVAGGITSNPTGAGNFIGQAFAPEVLFFDPVR